MISKVHIWLAELGRGIECVETKEFDTLEEAELFKQTFDPSVYNPVPYQNYYITEENEQ